ncbi:hypothetical protein R5W24_000765 [Gemmata sp. JC717]|uniref:Transcriptional regulator n=1 Tax=Gemmata algarum TaxID=2975278 RepID=A0ABU5F3F8_9BACT|nr:hypothetical protein [Gemmata algarum]MDY3551686.1 hypothetical protein [Gemmata algarum]MDY3562113.1 hypothetical protein [Gemmata algarum]
MASVRCPCHGNPACQLCHGTKFYEYQPGPRGWLPFACPTCAGTGSTRTAEGTQERCITCKGSWSIDPGYPPMAPGWRGALRAGWKTFFGGG